MWCPEPACLKQENTEFSYFDLRKRFETEKRFVVRGFARLCLGSALGWLWLWVWYGARLHLALGMTHVQWTTLIRAGLSRSSARLGSVRVLARYPTRLDSRLHFWLGSAQLRSGSIRFGLGRYSRLCSARLEAGLYWLEALLGMARGSVRLGSSIRPARTRLEAQDSARASAWLGTRFGS